MLSNKEKLYEELSNSITRVYDANNVEILFTKAEIKEYKVKYSSCKDLTPTLFLDGEPIASKNKKVEFQCSCGKMNTILLYKFLMKNRLKCQTCKELDEDKINWQKKYFELRRKGIERGNKIRYTKRTYDFDNETEAFKEKYFKQHLTIEEFEKIKEYIYSVGDEIVDADKVKILLHEPATNAKKYRQMVVANGKFLPLKNVKLKCSNCGKVFSVSRLLKERVNNNNFECRNCYLTNEVFKVIKYNDHLNYQGGYELSFIEKCNEHNIDIVNGPTIQYTFKGKERNYLTDFYLPKYRIIIETKDNHVWHKKQVESGLWGAKENAAKEYCKQNGMEYRLLFPTDIDDFFEKLLKI